MFNIKKLQNTKNLSDFAILLNLKPKALSYILYKIEENKKYTSFLIDKRNGTQRNIEKPCEKIKLLQTRLANFLYKCISDLKSDHRYYLFHSHGFQKKRSIISNAAAHRRRRYVFNLDLENFFGTINFGRVRGFFINDKRFSLDPKVATIIAQIACYKNALPQGSPCSPIISNLIGNILDRRLSSLARSVKCTYTRYADDLTFSTNMKGFPPEIAEMNEQGKWEIGVDLLSLINKSGFTVNAKKTRMSLRCSRQMVTGLTVNDKVNINQDYYRSVRVMCDKLFRTGKYYFPQLDKSDKECISDLNKLEGRLSFIHFVKMRLDRRDSNKSKHRQSNDKGVRGICKLYQRFLFYKYFVVQKVPVIMTEGKTDVIYLKHAINALAKDFPLLAKTNDDKIERRIKFVKRDNTNTNSFNIATGTSGQAVVIREYKEFMKLFYQQPGYPVIILCDGDNGINKVSNAIKDKFPESKFLSDIDEKCEKPFYHLTDNLYLVKVPGEKSIEHLFPDEVLERKIDGKSFELVPSVVSKEKTKETYNKISFANKVIGGNRKDIDFCGFKTLLTNIKECIEDYEKRVN